MLSQLTSRSRSDSRPPPIQVVGRSTKVRSLIDFYNQKALQRSSVVTSRPYVDRHKIPSDNVRSLVQNFSRDTSAASGSAVSSRSGGRVLRDGTMSPIAFRKGPISRVALRGEVKLAVLEGKIGEGNVSQKTKYHSRKTSTGLRSVKNWKSSRSQKAEKAEQDEKAEKQIMTSEADEPVAKKSSRRRKPSRRSFVKILDSSGNPMPEKQIIPLTAPVLRALESEVTRSSSLEMEISMSPGDVVSDGESAYSQTSESSAKKFREQKKAEVENGTDIEVLATNPEPRGNDAAPEKTNEKREASIQQPVSPVSKRSGSWKGALKTVRNSFRKKPSTTESSLSTKLSDTLPYQPKPIKSLIGNLTPDSPATSYLSAPNSLRTDESPISNVQAQVQRLQMLETVDSEPENENILPSDSDTQKSLRNLDVDKVLQEVSSPSLSQPTEDPDTISGMGEMVSWDSTVVRQRQRSRTTLKQRKGYCRPVAGVFRSPERRQESPLKPVSPLRVIKGKTQTDSQETSETLTIPTNVLLTRSSMDTLTSFKELPLPTPPQAPDEVQEENPQTNKPLTSLAAVEFESLSDLNSPPPAKPPQEVRSPTLMREMAFPPLRLRVGFGDAPMEKKYFDDDETPETDEQVYSQVAYERNSVPKKRIFGDSDWRTDRRSSSGDVDQEPQGPLEDSRSLFDGQKTFSIPVPRFTALPWQNYIPLPEASDEEYGDLVDAEAAFSKYSTNPRPPAGAGTPEHLYPLYQASGGFTSQSLTEGTSVIEVGADGQDEMVTRGRRRWRS